MKIKNITILLFFISYVGFSQKNLVDCLIGRWEIIDPTLDEGDFRYTVYTQTRKLSILTEKDKFSYSTSFYGFLDSNAIIDDEIELKFIKKEGSYFCTYDVDNLSKKAVNVIILDHFYLSESCNELSYGNSKNYDGYKVQSIPEGILTNLPDNILSSFFNIQKIKSKKVNLFKSPNIPTKMYLLKNDPIEVLDEKDNWLHIRYYGNKTIEGWIKKEDLGE